VRCEKNLTKKKKWKSKRKITNYNQYKNGIYYVQAVNKASFLAAGFLAAFLGPFFEIQRRLAFYLAFRLLFATKILHHLSVNPKIPA
jgi:hypothetical protein